MLTFLLILLLIAVFVAGGITGDFGVRVMHASIGDLVHRRESIGFVLILFSIGAVAFVAGLALWGGVAWVAITRNWGGH